jgi:hypothetical protein
MKKDGKTPGGKQRWGCYEGSGKDRQICYTTTDPSLPYARDQSGQSESLALRDFDPEIKSTDTFIITWAANATSVHGPFWASLTRYAKKLGAQILVHKGRYKHQLKSKDDDGEWYDDVLAPYLINKRFTINKNLELLADIPILPTAVTPLTGLEGFGDKSKIVGHPRLQFKTVATPGHKMASLLTTTGSCTRARYSNSRAGKHGQFHHTLGAVIVEVEGPLFWARHLNANTRGEFIDLDVKVTPDGIEKAPPPIAAVLGDTHARVADETVDQATFGPGGIVQRYRPNHIVFHDLDDGQSHNPHEEKDPFVEQALSTENRDDVEAEVKFSAEYVRNRTPSWATSHVVSDNHGDFLRRYIVTRDWKKLSPKNREFYLKSALMMVQGAKLVDGMPSYPSPFPAYLREHGGPNVKVVSSGESLIFEGIQCGFHGHRGPNGAKGSIKNMRRIGEKSIIGHSHSPGIDEGCMQVGHSAKANQPYTLGAPSSWMHAHALIYPGGKRQLIIIVAGRHRR